MATLVDKSRYRMSDIGYMMKSVTLIAPDDGYYGLIRVPQYAFITDVWLDISVAYVGGAPSLSIGWLGNGETAVVDGFITSSIAKPLETGIKYSVHDTATSDRSKYFGTKGGLITCTIAAGGATTEGTFCVFCQYYLIQ
jgi:hypothetical protein